MSEARFSIIPGWIVTDARLKGRDLQVLCLLGRYTNRKHGWCRRSQVQMAKELSLARSTVQESINRLVDMGGVERRSVVSDSGRDSAHWYRVIYDREVSSNAFSEWDASDEEEFGPMNADESADTPCRHAGTPAGIPAPPAGSEPAPPAGPGPAPINDSTLTTDAEREEKERGRDDGIGEDNPKAIERAFRRWFPTWPTYVSDSEDDARAVWRRLSAAERQQASDMTEAYAAAVQKVKRSTTCSAAVYLRERRWLRLPAKPTAAEAPAVEGPFGKGWGALRMADLLQPPRPLPPLTRLVEQMILSGAVDKATIEHERLAKFGWPRVVSMHEAASHPPFRGTMVPPEIKALGTDFINIRVGGDLWDAWKRLHEARGWPWLPDTGKLQHVWLPPIPEGFEGDADEAVRAAMDLFAARVREVRGDEHAA